MIGNDEYKKYHIRSTINKSLNILEGILLGIQIDNVINEDEINELNHWLDSNHTMFYKAPFDELVNLIKSALADLILTKEEIEDILWLCNNFKNLENGQYYNTITNDIQRLNGILYGIMSDNIISNTEILELQEWLNNNEQLKQTYPYDEVYSLLIGILADGVIDEHENKILKLFFADFIDTTTSYNINSIEYANLKKELNISGICATDPDIEIDNKVFCFNGKSSKTDRNTFKTIISKNGGIYNDTITNSTNYLVVGNECNPC